MISWSKNAELPVLSIWWRDSAKALVDFSGAVTWQLKIGVLGSPALLTKTTGITGAAGSGVAPTGVPNVTVAWAAGELNLAKGVYDLQLTATTAGLDRVLRTTIEIQDVIT